MIKRYVIAAFFSIGALALFLSAPGEAQPNKKPGRPVAAQPIFIRNVGFAITDAVRNLPPARAGIADSELLGEAGRSGEGEEKNPLNTKFPEDKRERSAQIPFKDDALQGNRPIASASPGPAILTFEGISDADNQNFLTGGRVAPSDENIDVGPNHIVQVVNDGFRVWDKSGNPLIPPTLISSLFARLGGVCANTDNGDPVILYDRLADRWFITQFGFLDFNNPPYHQCVAVSQNGDPTGAYFAYDFVTVGAEFPDYGKFGVWPDGYYMTVNQFTNGGPFNGVGAYALDRQKMLIGDPAAGMIYFNLDGTSHPEFIYSMLPSDHDGQEAPPAGAPNVFAYLNSDEFESPPFNVDAVRMFNFHADFHVPANSTFLERPESPVHIAAYDPRSNDNGAPGFRADIKQPPPATLADAFDTIEYHWMNRMQYRNRGGVETLVGALVVNVSGIDPTGSQADYQAGVRYAQFQKASPDPAPYQLYDNATFSPDAGNPATGVNRTLPAAAIDHEGNLAVSYTVSSTSIFPGIRYAGRDFNALGGLVGEQTLFAGIASQLGSANRWGDYQSLSVDPADDCTFWTTNQYYAASGAFDWHTRIGSFKFPTCQPPAMGTLHCSVVDCESGAPLSGVIFEADNGYSSTSHADGTTDLKLPPGFYTVTVSDTNRNCDSAFGFAQIVDGQTTNFSGCLSGSAKPVTDTFIAPPVVSGGNGNGIIDANECNNLIVPVQNQGCAPAHNVSAVLSTSTAGVTITQPNSAYPDMAIDQFQNNNTAFKVSTAPGFACGTPIDFTLTVSFSGGNQVSHFSITTCTETQPPIVVNGSLDPGDPDTANGRLGRNNVISTCGLGKTCPGPLGAGGRSFDQIPFVNSGPLTACVDIQLDSAGGTLLIGSVYLGSFDPTNLCTNYLGDAGNSSATRNWDVDVPPGATIVVVIEEVNAGTPSTPYTVTVSGLSAPPIDGGGVCVVATPTPSPTPQPTPIIHVRSAPNRVSEGHSANFVVEANRVLSQPVTVNYSLSGNATYGGDYSLTPACCQATIPAGQMSVSVVLDAFADGVRERRGETATMTIQPGSGYLVTTSRRPPTNKASIKIVD